MPTGVLLVGLGRVTRPPALPARKPARNTAGRVVFGVATDTLDGAGAVLERAEMSFTTRAELDTAARTFVGDIEQVPPMVSALKVGGRRLYELARAGEEVERAARPVHIAELAVEDLEAGRVSRGDDPGRVLDRYLHPHARGRSRRRARRPRAPRRVAAAAGRQLHPRRVASARGHEADPDAAVLSPTEAMRDLERVVVDGERARAGRARRDVSRHPHWSARPTPPVRSQSSTKRAHCSPCTSGAAVGVKPSVVVANEAALS